MAQLTPLAEVLQYQSTGFDQKIGVLKQEANRIRQNRALAKEQARQQAVLQQEYAMRKNLFDYEYGKRSEAQTQQTVIEQQAEVQQTQEEQQTKRLQELLDLQDKSAQRMTQLVKSEFSEALKIGGVITPLPKVTYNQQTGQPELFYQVYLPEEGKSYTQELYTEGEVIDELKKYQSAGEILQRYEQNQDRIQSDTVYSDGKQLVGGSEAVKDAEAIRQGNVSVIEDYVSGAKSFNVGEQSELKQNDGAKETYNNVNFTLDYIHNAGFINDEVFDFIKKEPVQQSYAKLAQLQGQFIDDEEEIKAQAVGELLNKLRTAYNQYTKSTSASIRPESVKFNWDGFNNTYGSLFEQINTKAGQTQTKEQQTNANREHVANMALN